MRSLLVAVILVCVYLLASRFAGSVVSPFTYAQKRKSEEDRKYEDKGFDFYEFQKGVSKRMPIIDMDEEYEEELCGKIDRLGIDITPREIRQLQLLYSGVVGVVAFIAFLLGQAAIAGVLAVIAVFVWRLPVARIDREIKNRDAAVEEELPRMYSVLYYTYKRNPSADLIQKVQSYIKNTSDLFYKEMMLFIEDSRNGDIYALRQFKKRVPISVVMRFCDIMENRLIGYDNLSIMYDFKVEMLEKMAEREDMMLKKFSHRLDVIANVGVMVPIGLILMVYFGAQIVQTLKGF